MNENDTLVGKINLRFWDQKCYFKCRQSDQSDPLRCLREKNRKCTRPRLYPWELTVHGNSGSIRCKYRNYN